MRRAASMRAICVSSYGGPEVLLLREMEEPRVRPGQARVRLAVAGVNFLDIYRRRGDMKVPMPYIPGMEGAGVVEEVGEGVQSVRPGDRVTFTNQTSTYAELASVPADSLIPLTDDISFEQGGALAMQGLTAHYLLHDFRPVKPGDTVLIHAAAGGTGLLLVQWARHLGARVIGTVSNKAKQDAVYEAGAHHVVLYTEQDFHAETRRFTGGHGADLIIDGVGKSTFLKNLNAAALRGHIVFYGFSSGLPEPVAPGVLTVQSLTLSSARLRNHILTRAELLERARAVMEGVRAGWLNLRFSVLPLAEASEAHRRLEQRESMGKLLLAAT
jgi:NADPH2:quinone reductase